MARQYPIMEVQLREKQSVEQMGTKEKFWFREANEGRLWLFKYNRPNTGEDWSERIAAEIGELLGITHARVELATCEERPGVISLDFTADASRGDLIHGNELLYELTPGYPRRQLRRVSQHSVANILTVLQQVVHLPADAVFPDGIREAEDLFLGYLLLDALVGNTDRHHENWGIIAKQTPVNVPIRAELAPSYDHASCLGRELRDKERERRCTNDQGHTVEAYAQRAVSAIYGGKNDPRPLSTVDAFFRFAESCHDARQTWLDRLSAIDDDSLRAVVQRVPGERMSHVAKQLASKVLEYNKARLLARAD